MKHAATILLLICGTIPTFAQDCADEDYKCQVAAFMLAGDAGPIFSFA